MKRVRKVIHTNHEVRERFCCVMFNEREGFGRIRATSNHYAVRIFEINNEQTTKNNGQNCVHDVRHT